MQNTKSEQLRDNQMLTLRALCKQGVDTVFCALNLQWHVNALEILPVIAPFCSRQIAFYMERLYCVERVPTQTLD